MEQRLKEIKQLVDYKAKTTPIAEGVLYVGDAKWLIQQTEKVERYKKEIIELRGKLHLSCPKCNEDCQSWIVEGKPCSKDW